MYAISSNCSGFGTAPVASASWNMSVAERAGGGKRGSDGGKLFGAFDAGAYAGFFAGEGESAGGTGVWEGDRE